MPEYVTTEEAAAHLGVTGSRVRQLLLAGVLSGEKRLGERSWHVRVSSLEWYEKGRRHYQKKGKTHVKS